METENIIITPPIPPVESNVYPHGLPFGQGLAKNLDMISERVFTLNKAGMIIIDGGTGSGKTTLGVEIADYYNKDRITFEEQLAMGGEDFQDKLSECYQKNKHVVVYDEAGDFNRRASLTRFNADLNRIFETYRVFKIIVILILPSFDDLDESILKKEIPRFLIHCYSRTNKYGCYKAYSLARMYFIKKFMKQLAVKPQAYEIEEANIHGHFLDLPPIRKEELTKYTVKGKLDILELKKLKQEGLITMRDIARLTGRSIEQVRLKIQSLKIKGVKKAGNGSIRLYPIEALNEIRKSIYGYEER